MTDQRVRMRTKCSYSSTIRRIEMFAVGKRRMTHPRCTPLDEHVGRDLGDDEADSEASGDQAIVVRRHVQLLEDVGGLAGVHGLQILTTSARAWWRKQSRICSYAIGLDQTHGWQIVVDVLDQISHDEQGQKSPVGLALKSSSLLEREQATILP